MIFMWIHIGKGKFVQLPGRPILAATIVVIVLAVLYFSFTSVFQVDQSEEGVVTTLGAHTRTVGPGLHTKLPYPISRVDILATDVVDEEDFGYRTSAQGARVMQGYESERHMLTGDLNIVLAGWDVQFTRPDPEKYLFNVREPEETLRDIAQSVMREILGDMASIRSLTLGRAEITQQARQKIQEQANRFDMGIQVSEVNLTFVDPPDPVQSAFDDLNKAVQDADRFFQEASQEYEKRVPEARGKAERRKREAQGQRDRRIEQAEGEAARFKSVLAEYREAPEVTRQRLFLETMEDNIPKLDRVIIVDQNLDSILPHWNLEGERP
jgi:membrane protease subunit HflK